MVDQELVNYLKDGISRGYDSAFLKKQLLDAGWNVKDVDEAIAGLDSEKITTQGIKEGKKGFKWMKIAGIIGIIFFILEIVLAGYWLISTGGGLTDQGISIQNPSKFVVITISILFLIMLELYFFGFVRMGKKTESGLLKFSGIIFMLLPIVVAILGYIGYTTMNSVSNNMATAFTGAADLSEILSPIYTIFTVYIIFFVIYLIVQFLFSFGLMKIKEKVKFSLTSGIFHLVLAVATTLTVGLFAYIFIKLKGMSSEELFGLLMSGGGDLLSILSIIKIIGYVMIVVMPLATLFSSLALLNASKNFE